MQRLPLDIILYIHYICITALLLDTKKEYFSKNVLLRPFVSFPLLFCFKCTEIICLIFPPFTAKCIYLLLVSFLVELKNSLYTNIDFYVMHLYSVLDPKNKSDFAQRTAVMKLQKGKMKPLNPINTRKLKVFVKIVKNKMLFCPIYMYTVSL